MIVRKFVATAMLAAASTVICAGTVHAETTPAPIQAPAATPALPVQQGVDGSVGYVAQGSADGRGVVAELDSGAFALDGSAVTITDAAGSTIGSIPTAYQIAGQHITLIPAISASGRELTLTPVGMSRLDDVAAKDFQTQLGAAAGGAVIGGIVGVIAGLVLTFIINGILLGPAGWVLSGFGLLLFVGGGLIAGATLGGLAGYAIANALP
ncbi:hypothetical protein [Nocardia sp. NPDC059195]|uniref:hypothetical protein n=1 Tax=Nocardia sp. NPDC059195 TaxID=3346765 RepID=UPI0036B751F9